MRMAISLRLAASNFLGALLFRESEVLRFAGAKLGLGWLIKRAWLYGARRDGVKLWFRDARKSSKAKAQSSREAPRNKVIKERFGGGAARNCTRGRSAAVPGRGGVRTHQGAGRLPAILSVSPGGTRETGSLRRNLWPAASQAGAGANSADIFDMHAAARNPGFTDCDHPALG
ncbi:hypothetical protein LBMAG56_03070 [Verrucomicrobiota bacterium]|nr:hypothetical protein LBMAG56_03070 [Verrucomicrobiota bacterium]